MCADCHSTDLQKNYRLAEDRFDTTWTDIDVSCEACHGPGSRHVAWAQPGSRGAPPSTLRGLVVSLRDTPGNRWALAPGESIARRTVPLASRAEVETCGRCHARRAPVGGDAPAGAASGAGVSRESPGEPALPCRWPDPRRGLRVRLVPPEPHVPRRRDLLELPRSAQRAPPCRGQCGVRAVSPHRQVRRAPASRSTRRAPRALGASPATCPSATTWWSTAGAITASACPAPISPGSWAPPTPAPIATESVARVGGGGGGPMVWAGAQGRLALRGGTPRRADRPRRCGEPTPPSGSGFDDAAHRRATPWRSCPATPDRTRSAPWRRRWATPIRWSAGPPRGRSPSSSRGPRRARPRAPRRPDPQRALRGASALLDVPRRDFTGEHSPRSIGPLRSIARRRRSRRSTRGPREPRRARCAAWDGSTRRNGSIAPRCDSSRCSCRPTSIWPTCIASRARRTGSARRSRAALKVDPRNGDVHEGLGLSLVRQKRLPEALPRWPRRRSSARTSRGTRTSTAWPCTRPAKPAARRGPQGRARARPR